MSERVTVSERVRQALELTTDDAELHPHTSWEVAHLLTLLKPSDITPAEMMAMAVILAHAHARKLSRPPLTAVTFDGFTPSGKYVSG